jgi:nondiscriminating aspartyl-tRNA synthetase
MKKIPISQISYHEGKDVILRGWVYRLRSLAKTTFILLHDCTGIVQCVISSDAVKHVSVKLDYPIEIRGKVRADKRAVGGFEIDIEEIKVLNETMAILPFNASSDITDLGQDILLANRPLTLRNEKVGDIFRIQAALVQYFRSYLLSQHFTEIFTSKIVASGTEGGTNLFEIKYFDRIAYLAQSPQFFKEYGVAGFERVFETGHVYRAEPHASSRHLTEYYSLDVEFGFIDSVEEVIDLERELLTYMFEKINQNYGESLKKYNQPYLPSMLTVPIWTFDECLERLKKRYNRADLRDDLDPLAERQLCELAEEEIGIPAVFVLGFPLAKRPFYVMPRGNNGASESFDLLFHGLEITTGGQRHHTRQGLELALKEKGLDVDSFEQHLHLFDLGMPPHGGFAIGAERLTAKILGLSNIRQATLYPRDRYHISP